MPVPEVVSFVLVTTTSGRCWRRRVSWRAQLTLPTYQRVVGAGAPGRRRDRLPRCRAGDQAPTEQPPPAPDVPAFVVDVCSFPGHPERVQRAT